MMLLPCQLVQFSILPLVHWNFSLTLMVNLLHANVICSLVVGAMG